MAIRPVTGTVGAGAVSDPIPLDWREIEFNVGIRIAPTSTGVGIVQMTLDNLLSPGVTPVWTTISNLSSVVSSSPQVVALTTPCIAIRVSNGDAGGTVPFQIVQAG